MSCAKHNMIYKCTSQSFSLLAKCSDELAIIDHFCNDPQTNLTRSYKLWPLKQKRFGSYNKQNFSITTQQSSTCTDLPEPLEMFLMFAVCRNRTDLPERIVIHKQQ